VIEEIVMKSILKKFWRNEDGGETVEYALVIGVIVVGIGAIIVAISDDVSTLFEGINSALS
jgi:Flp pilus assembly pilin Flp